MKFAIKLIILSIVMLSVFSARHRHRRTETNANLPSVSEIEEYFGCFKAAGIGLIEIGKAAKWVIGKIKAKSKPTIAEMKAGLEEAAPKFKEVGN